MVARRGDDDRSVAAQDLPVDHSLDVFSIPNVITVLRLALIPFFWWFLVYEPPHSGPNDIAFGLFAVSAATDWLDGLIARRTGHVTAIGKIIDPLVDRLLIASALFGLLSVGRVSIALVLVLIGRDVYLLYGAWMLERHGRRVAVTILGKATTAVLLSGFASLIWNYPTVDMPFLGTLDLGFARISFGGPRAVGSYIVYAGVVMSLSAAVQYTFVARRIYREAIAERTASGPA